MTSLTLRKIIFVVLCVLAALLLAVSTVHAANLTVDFNPDPLFEAKNILPGDTESGEVMVTNSTGSTQEIYVESVNGFDPDKLGSQLHIRVIESGTLLYQDEFGDFLSAGPISLSSLENGNSTTYIFEVSFIDSADSDYMGKTLGFDLCIGFAGGSSQCGDTVVSDPENPGEEDEEFPGGSSGGGGNQFVALEIFNENALVVEAGTPVATPDGVTLISWTTNRLSTSQVIYGLASGGPYTLDLDAPNLGYPFSTPEDLVKVTDHSVLIQGLIEGQTYVYRVVSRASPPTISEELTFTQIAHAGHDHSLEPGTGTSTVSTILSTIQGAGSDTDTLENSDLLALALFGSGFDAYVTWGLLILILILLLVLWLVRRRRKQEEEVSV